MPLITGYVAAAMAAARYRMLDDGSYIGEIPGLQGVWANHATLDGCRDELQEVLEEWLLLKLRDGDPLPVFGGIDLNRVTT